MELALGLVLVIVLVAANGFFVAVEFALVAADRQKIDARAADGQWAAKSALAAFRRLSFHLSGAQLGITLTSIVLGFLTEPLVGSLIDPVIEPLVGSPGSGLTIALSIAIATMLQTVVGELIPKNIAIARAEAVSLALLPAARVVHGVFSPMIVLFNGAANWIVRRLGIEPKEELTSVRSLEEIDYLIRSSGATGEITADALDLLSRTIRFSEKDAADALTPRVHVTGLVETATVADLLLQARESGHSRYPVYGEDLDDIKGVVDIISVFDLSHRERERTSVTDIMIEAVVVPETRDLSDVLDDIRRTGSQLLVVVDEHGGTAGVLTLEDVLEEITGDIDDEYDDADVVTTPLNSGVAIVAGTLHGDEVEQASGFVFPEGEYETIAGFILDQLGRIPDEGDVVVFEDTTLEIVAMDGRRIASIQITDNQAMRSGHVGETLERRSAGSLR